MAIFEGVFEMKDKWAIFAILVGFLVLATSLNCEAVDTTKIDAVRSKGVLDGEDLRVIDSFVADAVAELVGTRNFTSIGKIRTAILSRSSSEKSSAEAQYAAQLSESVYRHISAAFEKADELTPEDRKAKTIINLLILVDGLEDSRLADLALERVDDHNMVVRYWAVHSVTGPGFTNKLNSGQNGDLELARRIVGRLGEVVEQSSPEIIGLITGFAAEVNVPQGKDLLLRVADIRISRYADWTVEYELLDGTILGLLDKKMDSGSSTDPEVARRFAQLYSYVLQRYVKGRDFLEDTQKQQLASVLIEIERSYLGKYVGIAQSTIKRAVEEDAYITLLQEHNKLLGDQTRPGQLLLKLNFDYGGGSNGGRRTSPLVLPEPPVAEVSE